MTGLPVWALYFQALGPIAVTAIASVFALVIQRRMWRNAENKLKIELFDRRFRVLQGVNKARSIALSNGKFDNNNLSEFDELLGDSFFLFDKGTNDFIIEIRKKLVFILVYDKSTIDESGNDRSKLIRKKYKNMEELLDDYNKLINMMKPFMDLSGVKI